MKRYLLCGIVVIYPFALFSQTLSGDSILANERSIDRPVTLHARQFRVTGGYGLSIIARRFDSKGETVHLRDEGLASIRHRLNLDIKFGITDFFQVNAGIAHASNVVREQSKYIIATEPPSVSQDVIHEYKGLEDLYVGFDIRAPLNTRKVDIAITLGAALPVAPFEPAQPEHTFEAVNENGTEMNNFIYHYNYSLGKGIVVAQLGGIVKYRSSSWAVSARVDYQHGLKDGSSYEWRHQLNDDSFEYRKHPVMYRLPDANSYHIEGEYQPLPWFDVFMIVSGHTAFDGWTSTQEGVKVATPYQTSWIVSPGFEIIVTPKLWLRERINFSVAGKSYEAPLSFQTTLMYNFFPIE